MCTPLSLHSLLLVQWTWAWRLERADNGRNGGISFPPYDASVLYEPFDLTTYDLYKYTCINMCTTVRPYFHQMDYLLQHSSSNMLTKPLVANAGNISAQEQKYVGKILVTCRTWSTETRRILEDRPNRHCPGCSRDLLGVPKKILSQTALPPRSLQHHNPKYQHLLAVFLTIPSHTLDIDTPAITRLRTPASILWTTRRRRDLLLRDPAWVRDPLGPTVGLGSFAHIRDSTYSKVSLPLIPLGLLLCLTYLISGVELCRDIPLM